MRKKSIIFAFVKHLHNGYKYNNYSNETDTH